MLLFLGTVILTTGAPSRPSLLQEEKEMPTVQHVNHAIDYIEFSVNDMAEAKRFYGAAFQWEFTDYGAEYAGIRNIDAEGEMGGLRPVEKVNTGGPLVILYSGDLEKSLASVKDAGGKISKEIFSFPGGRRFEFLDPAGNELAVWSDK